MSFWVPDWSRRLPITTRNWQASLQPTSRILISADCLCVTRQRRGGTTIFGGPTGLRVRRGLGMFTTRSGIATLRETEQRVPGWDGWCQHDRSSGKSGPVRRSDVGPRRPRAVLALRSHGAVALDKSPESLRLDLYNVRSARWLQRPFRDFDVPGAVVTSSTGFGQTLRRLGDHPAAVRVPRCFGPKKRSQSGSPADDTGTGDD